MNRSSQYSHHIDLVRRLRKVLSSIHELEGLDVYDEDQYSRAINYTRGVIDIIKGDITSFEREQGIELRVSDKPLLEHASGDYNICISFDKTKEELEGILDFLIIGVHGAIRADEIGLDGDYTEVSTKEQEGRSLVYLGDLDYAHALIKTYEEKLEQPTLVE